MNILLINAKHLEEIRIASINISNKSGYKVSDLYIENTSNPSTKKNIYAGIVERIIPGTNAAFVDYGAKDLKGEKKSGFLPRQELCPKFLKNKEKDSIEDTTLAVGQSIIVQVKNDPQGSKGALLTTNITLASHYLVLNPTNSETGGISQQLVGEERDAVREIPNQLDIPTDMSIILRTAGTYPNIDALKENLALLLKQWHAIQEKCNSKKAPFLLLKEEDIVIRAIRDYLPRNVSSIVIDDPATFEKVKTYVSKIRPDLIKKLSLHESTTPLFTHFDIEHEVESAFQSTLRLPSGGTIVFDRAEALVAIDVNSSGSIKHKNIAETALRTNLEAAELIARQLRLRDLGGLVVIDFIDMETENDKQQVENKLRDCMREDRARIQTSSILPRFGTILMSRQKLRSSLAKTNEDTCPYCEGRGIRRSIESLALSTIRNIEKTLFQKQSKQLKIESSIELATYLANEQREALYRLEQNHHCKLILVPNPYWKSAYCKITDLAQTGFNTQDTLQNTSYQLLSSRPNDMVTVTQAKSLEVPAVEGLNESNLYVLEKKKNIFSRTLNKWRITFQSLFHRSDSSSVQQLTNPPRKRLFNKTRASVKGNTTIKTERPFSTRISAHKHQKNETDKKILPKLKKTVFSPKTRAQEENNTTAFPLFAKPAQITQDKLQNTSGTMLTLSEKTNTRDQILTNPEALKLLSTQGNKKTNNKNMQRFGGEAKVKRRTYTVKSGKETVL